MRGFVALFRKEWRDLRATTWAYAGFVLAACLLVRWSLAAFSVKNADPNWQRYLDGFVPVAALLFAAMAAADSIGGETASRRIDQLVLLPVRPLTVWSAKLSAIAAAVAIVLAWSTLVQVGVLAAIDGRAHVERFVEFAGRVRWAPVGIAGFLSMTFLVSTLRLRGIGALVAGAGLAAAAGAGIVRYASAFGLSGAGVVPREIASVSGGDVVAIGAAVTAVVLLASALAFTFGRVHLSVARPAVIASSVLAILVGAPAGAFAAARMRVLPEHEETALQWVEPSPDGRHVALWFVRDRGERARSASWVLDVATGALRELPRSQIRIRAWGRGSTWDADGSLLVQDFASSRVERDWIDPVTLEPRRSARLTFRELGDEDRALAEEWRESHAWVLQGSSKRPDTAPPTDPPLVGRIERFAGNREKLTIPTWIPPVMQYGTDRVVYAPEPCVLAVKRLPDGPARVIARSSKPFVRGDVSAISADGAIVLVRLEGAWKAVSTDGGDARDVAIADASQSPGFHPVQGDPSRRIVVAARRDETVAVLDLDSGAVATIPASELGTLLAMPDGALLIWRGKRLDLFDRELRRVRCVWSIPAEGGAK